MWLRRSGTRVQVPPVEGSLLDQVSSQRLVRIAAESGRRAEAVAPATGVTAADHSARRRRQLGLGAFFLALSLFALGGMAFQLLSIGDDGWQWDDGLQLALMLVLLIAVFGQSRGMLRATGPGRKTLDALRSARHRFVRGSAASVLPAAAPVPAGLALLDATFPGELETADLAARSLRPSTALHLRRASRGANLALLVGALVLSGAAFVAGLVLIPYVAILGGFDPALLLSIPFTALAGYAFYQFARGAVRSSFRGRTYYLASRAFRDSVRAWGSGSLLVRVALTSTAAVSVAGVGVTNFVIQNPVRSDLFVYDAGDGSLYRIDLGDGANVNIGQHVLGTTLLSMVTLPKGFESARGQKVPKGSVLALVAAPRGLPILSVLPPGNAKPFTLGPLAQPLASPFLAVLPTGELFAMDANGGLWRVNPATGAVSTVAATGLRVSAFAFDPGARAFIAVAGAHVMHIDAAGRVTEAALAGLAGLDVCSLLLTPSGWMAGDRASGQVMVIDARTGTNAGVLAVDGQVAFKQPCALALAAPHARVAAGDAVATPAP